MAPTHNLGELAYEQASVALAQQREVLDGLRARAGTLLSGAAISTSFLGGQALAVGSLRATSWLAIACFVAVGVASAAVHWPQLDFELTARPFLPELVGRLGQRPAATARLTLAEHMHVAYQHNEPYVARVATYVQASALFLVLEVVSWVVDLATRT